MVSPTTLSIASPFSCSKNLYFTHTRTHTHRGTYTVSQHTLNLIFTIIFRACSFLYLEYFSPYFPHSRTLFFKFLLKSHIFVRPCQSLLVRVKLLPFSIPLCIDFLFTRILGRKRLGKQTPQHSGADRKYSPCPFSRSR